MGLALTAPSHVELCHVANARSAIMMFTAIVCAATWCFAMSVVWSVVFPE